MSTHRPPVQRDGPTPPQPPICDVLAGVVSVAVEHGWHLIATSTTDKGGRRHHAGLERAGWHVEVKAELVERYPIESNVPPSFDFDWRFVGIWLEPVRTPGDNTLHLVPGWFELEEVHRILTATVADLETLYSAGISPPAD